jgi:hypothetical protein
MTLHNNSSGLAERNVGNWLKYMTLEGEVGRMNIDREIWILRLAREYIDHSITKK